MPETIQEYRAHGGTHCPYCGSEDITGGSVQIGAASAWQPITCSACGRKWTDVYNLIAFEPDEVREGE